MGQVGESGKLGWGEVPEQPCLIYVPNYGPTI